MSTTTTPTVDPIDALRVQITAIDDDIIALVARRRDLSRQVGALRMAAGGTRLSLSREQAIVTRFANELGPDGTALAMLLLQLGRGQIGGGRAVRSAP